ncbi:unnamed protein product, partial [Discosporangium mesarthrocarpum]
EIFARLRARLPDTTFILVAHRPPGGFGELRHISLSPNPEIPIFDLTK